MPEPAFTGQGTRLDETAPWMSYASEMEESLPADLVEEIAEYALHRYEDGPVSSQTQEELCFQREVNENVGKDYQFLTPAEYEDVEQRIGIVMSHAELIIKLRSAGINCWYVQHPHPDKAVLMVKSGSKPVEVACWVQIGQMPELSIMRFDQYGVPLDERRRGWRTCVLQLILKGVLTEDTAVELFGRPKQTKAFDRYNSTLYEWRKRSNGFEE